MKNAMEILAKTLPTNICSHIVHNPDVLSCPHGTCVFTSAQSHSNVIGICHKSCGTKGCWNAVVEVGGTPDASRGPPGDGETGKLEAGVFISFNQDNGFEGENADG